MKHRAFIYNSLTYVMVNISFHRNLKYGFIFYAQVALMWIILSCNVNFFKKNYKYCFILYNVQKHAFLCRYLFHKLLWWQGERMGQKKKNFNELYPMKSCILKWCCKLIPNTFAVNFFYNSIVGIQFKKQQQKRQYPFYTNTF